MRGRILAGTVVLLAFALPALAQSEGALREHFEGRRVVVKIDMPATKEGVNLQADRGRAIDRKKVSRDLRRYGTAFYTGDFAEITLIKVKGKHIEFQLNGGGWSGGRTVPLYFTPVAQSQRELDILAELILLRKKQKDHREDPERNRKTKEKSRLQRILEEDLAEMSHEREAIDAEHMAEARAKQAEAQEHLDRQVRASGSRFNVRFKKKVPADALTPDGFMAMLEKYVDFSEEAVRAAQEKQARKEERQESAEEAREEEFEPASAGEILKQLRKGLLWKDALELLGPPARQEEYREGALQVKSCLFDRTPLGIIDTEFVEDVLVRYTISSR